MVSALLERDGRSKAPFEWLERSLGGPSGPNRVKSSQESGQIRLEEQYRDHLLDAIGTRSSESVAKESPMRLQRAARRALAGSSGSTSERALSQIIIGELVRRFGPKFLGMSLLPSK